ncbi:gluconokinase [Parvularcula sp. LCG005]|uniref:gluconokinase n=1 Tax=Parvularcula sp. LCG005 TaxID=3078805 RepID=UPI002943D66D|nr:gluconokinase [Parvularcula sp. LCG005]WOI52414.1 gluconokinase [Parvularcula sp. LCG005]
MQVIVVMGVSGSGKSTIGEMVADMRNIPFLEGDGYHPAQNRAKMVAGQPLSNDDRMAWLDAIISDVNDQGQSCVLACSALNTMVRTRLTQEISAPCIFVHLTGDRRLIQERIMARKGHFFDPKLLESQFAALENPGDAIAVDIADPPDVICTKICAALDARA